MLFISYVNCFNVYPGDYGKAYLYIYSYWTVNLNMTRAAKQQATNFVVCILLLKINLTKWSHLLTINNTDKKYFIISSICNIHVYPIIT